MTTQQPKVDSNKRPRDRSAMEKSLKKEIALTKIMHADNPQIPVLLVLYRWLWIMEDEDESEEQLDFFCEMAENFQTVESLKLWMNDIFWGKMYDNNNPEWLEHEWNIVADPNSVDFYAFKSKEDFIDQLDFEMAQRSLQAAWDRACDSDQVKQEG